jgi:hypothetical protein
MYTVSTNRTVADDMKSETVTEYLEIKINPEINPADFNVNKQ